MEFQLADAPAGLYKLISVQVRTRGAKASSGRNAHVRVDLLKGDGTLVGTATEHTLGDAAQNFSYTLSGLSLTAADVNDLFVRVVPRNSGPGADVPIRVFAIEIEWTYEFVPASTTPTATATPTSAVDSDRDGVPDVLDNCPNWPNPGQNLPPWLIPANDPDCDGFSTAVEDSVGTDPLAHCGTDAWPADINNNNFSDTADLALLTGNFGAAAPPAPARHNIAPDPVDGFIDTADIAKMSGFFGRSCS